MITDDEKLKWKTLDERELLKTRVFTVLSRREAAGGIEGDYIALDAPDCVVVIPEYEGNFVLVRQWRHGAGRLTLEFPGGVVDRGEDPRVAASRELREETGFTAGRLDYLGEYSPNPALFNSRFFCFLARDLKPAGSLELDPDELIRVELKKIGDVIADLGSPEESHAFMGAALAFYLRERMKNELH
ncbi:MAG: NUDIX domain-containing protein [Clostridiales bacterium]|nr:NUDIX domain-containing protein [Clostridiales bacterium]